MSLCLAEPLLTFAARPLSASSLSLLLPPIQFYQSQLHSVLLQCLCSAPFALTSSQCLLQVIRYQFYDLIPIQNDDRCLTKAGSL
jgi:hypothetical protein